MKVENQFQSIGLKFLAENKWPYLWLQSWSKMTVLLCCSCKFCVDAFFLFDFNITLFLSHQIYTLSFMLLFLAVPEQFL